MMPMIIVMMVFTIGAFVFAWQGVAMHQKVTAEEAKFHQLQSSYFNLSKPEREAAITGSALNKQLAEIQNYPSELLRLKLVGIGKILTGIFGLLFVIAILLFMMPVRLAQMINKK